MLGLSIQETESQHADCRDHWMVPLCAPLGQQQVPSSGTPAAVGLGVNQLLIGVLALQVPGPRERRGHTAGTCMRLSSPSLSYLKDGWKLRTLSEMSHVSA